MALEDEQERRFGAKQPSEAAFLKSQLEAERKRRRRKPPKGSPERRCLFFRTDGLQCQEDRLVRPSGALAPTCRTHTPHVKREKDVAKWLERLRSWEAVLLSQLNEVKRCMVVTIRDHMTAAPWSSGQTESKLTHPVSDLTHLVAQARKSASDGRQGQTKLSHTHQRLLPFPGKGHAWMRKVARQRLIELPQDTEYVEGRPTPIYPKPY